jgi:hypothetical protein
MQSPLISSLSGPGYVLHILLNAWPHWFWPPAQHTLLFTHMGLNIFHAISGPSLSSYVNISLPRYVNRLMLYLERIVPILLETVGLYDNVGTPAGLCFCVWDLCCEASPRMTSRWFYPLFLNVLFMWLVSSSRLSLPHMASNR